MIRSVVGRIQCQHIRVVANVSGRRRAVVNRVSSSAFSSQSGRGTWNWNKWQNSTEKKPQEEAPNNDAKISKETAVLKQCIELYQSLMPLNEKVHGPLEQQQPSDDPADLKIGKYTKLPFVFVLGNHSSGKSSFINYVLQRDIQTAGVAPTDDTFTVITSGPNDEDQDGPALIFGNPQLGFSSLSQFGPTLIHHTQLKVRKDIATTDFMIIDTPGMIDSPGASVGSTQDTYNVEGTLTSSTSHQPGHRDRGYDFPGVVRWFAERADVVLLFFDPDKPGTTGETLNILLHSLGGMDHKLLIVLNKADQFEKIHDFARAYGSLCWNLSKVIHRKDLPRIFTTCLPVKENRSEPAASLQAPSSPPSIHDESNFGLDGAETAVVNAPPSAGGLADLHATRDDVVKEVMKAPKRRVDNMITHLYDSVCLLEMHSRILQEIKSRYNRRYWECKYQEIGFFVVSGSLSGGVYSLSSSLPFLAASTGGIEPVVGAMVGTSILGLGGLTWYNTTLMKSVETNLTSPEGIRNCFQSCYGRQITEADEFVVNLWQRVRKPLESTLNPQMGGLSRFSSTAVTEKELQNLKSIVERDIPALRKQVSPTLHYTMEQ